MSSLGERSLESVCADGYVVLDDVRRDGASAGPAVVNRSGSIRNFNPLAVPALSAELAQAPDTVEGMLAFTANYGPLVGEWCEEVDAIDGVATDYFAQAELYSRWSHEAQAVRLAFDLLTAITVDDEDYIRVAELVRDDGHSLFVKGRGLPFRVPLPARLRQYIDDERDQADKVIRTGKIVLRHIVDSKMEEHVAARLLFDSDMGLSTAVAPRSLLGAVWYQMAKDSEDGRKLARCEVCGVVIRSARPSRRRFCGTACRVANHRATA